MDKKRLRRVVTVLERLPKQGRKFSLNAWVTHSGDHEPEKDNFCGTVACAVGWCMFDPVLKKAGLKMSKHANYPEYKGLGNFYAVSAFFDLTYSESYHLFSVSTYLRGSRLDVISRIKKFIATDGRSMDA